MLRKSQGFALKCANRNAVTRLTSWPVACVTRCDTDCLTFEAAAHRQIRAEQIFCSIHTIHKGPLRPWDTSAEILMRQLNAVKPELGLSGDHKCQLWIQLAGTTLLLLLLRSLRGWESHNQHWCTAAIIGLSCWQHGQWGCYFPTAHILPPSVWLLLASWHSPPAITIAMTIIITSMANPVGNCNVASQSRLCLCRLNLTARKRCRCQQRVCLLGLRACEVGSTKRRPLSRMSNSLFSLCRQRY